MHSLIYLQIPGLALKVGLKGTKGLKITTPVNDYFYNLWQNDPVPLILVSYLGLF